MSQANGSKPPKISGTTNTTTQTIHESSTVTTTEKRAPGKKHNRARAGTVSPDSGKKIVPGSVSDEFMKAALMDRAYVGQLDQCLGALCVDLIPKAHTEAHKGNYALLRTLMRYSQQANRRMQAEGRIRQLAAKKGGEAK